MHRMDAVAGDEPYVVGKLAPIVADRALAPVSVSGAGFRFVYSSSLHVEPSSSEVVVCWPRENMLATLEPMLASFARLSFDGAERRPPVGLSVTDVRSISASGAIEPMLSFGLDFSSPPPLADESDFLEGMVVLVAVVLAVGSSEPVKDDRDQQGRQPSSPVHREIRMPKITFVNSLVKLINSGRYLFLISQDCLSYPSKRNADAGTNNTETASK
uniref:Uncharacterized protein n=1 Tax=Anopheles farauti TaxID=69004 RepID=A0A182QR22_9DIPT